MKIERNALPRQSSQNRRIYWQHHLYVVSTSSRNLATSAPKIWWPTYQTRSSHSLASSLFGCPHRISLAIADRVCSIYRASSACRFSNNSRRLQKSVARRRPHMPITWAQNTERCSNETEYVYAEIEWGRMPDVVFKVFWRSHAAKHETKCVLQSGNSLNQALKGHSSPNYVTEPSAYKH